VQQVREKIALPQIVNVRPTLFDDHTWFAPARGEG